MRSFAALHGLGRRTAPGCAYRLLSDPAPQDHAIQARVRVVGGPDPTSIITVRRIGRSAREIEVVVSAVIGRLIVSRWTGRARIDIPGLDDARAIRAGNGGHAA